MAMLFSLPLNERERERVGDRSVIDRSLIHIQRLLSYHPLFISRSTNDFLVSLMIKTTFRLGKERFVVVSMDSFRMVLTHYEHTMCLILTSFFRSLQLYVSLVISPQGQDNDKRKYVGI